MDEMTFTLNSPITEEQWDMIADVDFEHTNEIMFYTKHGKEVKFVKEPHWIPCSERLPENCQYVLVTFSKYKWVDTDEFDDGRFCYHKYVTAWMPLPEPYRGL